MTADDERELREVRELLERAVPRLSAPASRMRGVRERVVRRRRRRTAVVASACAAVAAVLAGTLLPGPDADPEPEFAPPAASPSRERLIHPALGGLTLELPTGWHGLAVSEDRTRKLRAVAYAAPQPLSGARADCKRDGYGVCPPLDELPKAGGSLLILVLDHVSMLVGKAQSPPRLDVMPLEPVCRDIAASRQYFGLVKVSGQDAVLSATLCVSGGGESAQRQAEVVRRMLAGTEFSEFAEYATPPPGSATDDGALSTASTKAPSSAGSARD